MAYQSFFEVFPEELRRVPIPEWRILLVLAYDGPSTMYRIKKEYNFHYSAIHVATKSLKKLKWIRVLEKKRGDTGGTTKVYGLTLVGLLHLLHRIPKWIHLSQIYATRKTRELLPEEVKTALKKLSTQKDVELHLLHCFKFDKVAENNRRLLPLIYGKWNHFKNNDVSIDVFFSMVEVAHVTLGDYYSHRKRVSLPKLFAYKVYYNLLKESMLKRYSRRRKGYEPFDYIEMVQQKTIAVFRNDPELTALFKKISNRIENEIASLSKSIQKIKAAILP